MNFDTIIVGGGIAGLTSAAYIAKAGKSVAIFEKQEKIGGLVQTFSRDGVFFDTGLRSIENSGIVFPMLKQLGIDIDFIKSHVTVGIGDKIIKIENHESLRKYQEFLIAQFPENEKDIILIIKEIRKIMGYMDVLYGLDNPTFMEIGKDKKYLFKVFLPWFFKFMFTIQKIYKLNEPADEYLKHFTNNQQLIDAIAQHFFQKTPTSFALSYFSLYLDYFYPKGGTEVLPKKIADFIVKNGGEIRTSVKIKSLNPEQKFIIDDKGNKIEYKNLIWAADLKQLYNIIPISDLKDQNLKDNINCKIAELKDLKGSDSIFSIYLTVQKNKEYFSNICSGHFFYTPSKKGLSSVFKGDIDIFIAQKSINSQDEGTKEKVKKYLKEFCELNTFEIAIPAVRDADMAPEGKTGVMVSLLFDYQLAKKIDEAGWTEEMKEFLEDYIIEILDKNIFPGIKEKTIYKFSSSPLTIEKLTCSSDGAITGWAFTNTSVPVVNKMLKVAKSVDTILPSIFQAGQWTYSPAGLPISILTGKLAADKALK